MNGLNPCFIGQWATTVNWFSLKIGERTMSQSLFYWTMGYDKWKPTKAQRRELSQSLFYWTMGYDLYLSFKITYIDGSVSILVLLDNGLRHTYK